MENNEKLFNRNVVLILTTAFLMFMGFSLLMPLVAKYLVEEFQASPSLAGIVVSAYVITSLMARPFSGYLVDKFDRRKFLIITMFSFAILFLGYVFSVTVNQILITRILLGCSFAFVTTASNTLAVDFMPSERRGEGIGYMGAITVLSMAIGPMFGLYLIESYTYMHLFIAAFVIVFIGFILTCFVDKEERKPVVGKQKISLDRFIVIEGLSVAVIILLMYFLYGSLMTYVSLYLKEVHEVNHNAGIFFLCMCVGIAISRFVGAKLINKGMYSTIIIAGLVIVIAASFVFTHFLTNHVFLISSFCIGLGFGGACPAVQTMIINLVPHNRRGTANSTYFIAMDLGSGAGMLFGGIIAGVSSYRMVYIVGMGLCLLALIIYTLYSKGYYSRQISAKE